MLRTEGVAVALLITATSPVTVAGGGLDLSLGVEYSTGRYGSDQSTDIWYFPLAASYDWTLWNLRLTIPYVQMTGPGNLIGANDGLTGSASSNTRRSASGVGDITAALSRGLYGTDDGSLLLDITGQVKFGTADAALGLGTGENDFSLQASLLKEHDRWTIFSSIGRRYMGDTAISDFRDPWFASLGAAGNFGAHTQLSAAYTMRQKVLEDGAPLSEITLSATYRLGATRILQAYVVKGLADGSPDWGMGLALNY